MRPGAGASLRLQRARRRAFCAGRRKYPHPSWVCDASFLWRGGRTGRASARGRAAGCAHARVSGGAPGRAGAGGQLCRRTGRGTCGLPPGSPPRALGKAQQHPRPVLPARPSPAAKPAPSPAGPARGRLSRPRAGRPALALRHGGARGLSRRRSGGGARGLRLRSARRAHLPPGRAGFRAALQAAHAECAGACPSARLHRGAGKPPQSLRGPRGHARRAAFPAQNPAVRSCAPEPTVLPCAAGHHRRSAECVSPAHLCAPAGDPARGAQRRAAPQRPSAARPSRRSESVRPAGGAGPARL